MEIDRLEASLSAPIRHHTARVASDMARWVGRHREGALQLRSIRELEDYCYSVAGIVGELITDCFVAVIDPAPRVELELRASAADFGIGLQLVNVLKDAGRDAGEGRSYLPADFVPRPGEGAMRLSALVALAQSRLDRGLRYVLALPIEASGARRFCFVPLALATATLQVLARSGDRAFDGDDVKLSRERVLTLAEAACTAVADDGATRALWGRLRSELPASVVT
jgi:farnesyl-diphosphate farnesyltransferase